MNRTLLIFILFFIPPQLILSQNFRRELNSILFRDSTGPLENIFSGGINNPEHQFIDIDNDQDLDLFYLDSDGTFGYYLNTGNKFSADFSYSLDTVPGLVLKDWFYFFDADADGDFDVFTAGEANYIRYLANTGTPEIPFFITAEDTLKDELNNPVLTEFGSNPVLCDVDGDNDYDFILGNTAGTLTYFENNGNSTSFSFRYITDFWQDILIISGARLHGASSLDFADIDSDGDFDLFWGDFFSKSMYFIQNQGTPSEPRLVLTSRVYPPNQDSLLTSGFNMPRLADIDADGDLDMFVSVLYDPTVTESLIFYQNDGQPSNPDFRKITNYFLRTLDTGNQSVPVFVDLDSDGDKDLLIGSSRNPNGSLFYFRNEGSPSTPSYILVDSVYSGIQGELSIAPAAADLDGDNDMDLLIGNFNGTISFFRNDGTPFNPQFLFVDNLKDNSGNVIDAGLYARPFLTDVDSDNDIDLLCGGFDGKIILYRNTGSLSSFTFSREDSYFTFDIGDNSSPFLIDYDGDNDFDLFTGSREGKIYYFRNDGNNQNPQWILATDYFLNLDFGGDAVPVFCDIDSDTDMDLFTGNYKGGLYFFRNEIITGIIDRKEEPASDFQLLAYPIPFNSEVNIKVSVNSHREYKIIIYNIPGETVLTIFRGSLQKGEYTFRWNGTNDFNTDVSSGTYILTMNDGDRIISKKITKLK